MAKQKYAAGFRTKLMGGVPEADFPVVSKGDTADYHPTEGTVIYTSSSQANINAASANAGFNPVP